MNFSRPASPSILRTLRRGGVEAELLRLARDGDREAIAALYGRSRDRILRLAFHFLHDRDAAEDAAQEILLRAFEKMPAFRAESEFSTWLYRLALNHCLEKQRVMRRREALWELQPLPQNASSPARSVETRLALESALDALPEPLRVVLILRQWHELSYEEIAEVLRLPSGTVKSRLHEARRQFRLIWEAQNAL